MAYEFKKITEVEVVNTSTDNTNVLVEMDGAVKRVPAKEIGGAGSWNDLTDKPFGETSEDVVYLEETTKSFYQSGNSFEASDDTEYPSSLLFVEGESYTVIWDGVRYENLIAQKGDLGHISVGSIDETFSDYPFCIQFREEMGYSSSRIVTNNLLDHTVAVYKPNTVIKPIDSKYLYDTILDFGDQSVSIENSSFDYSKVSLIGSTYDELITKMQNGGVPKILICYNYVYGDYVYRMTSESLSVNYYIEVIDIVTLVRGYNTTGSILHLEIHSDGTCGGGLAN